MQYEYRIVLSEYFKEWIRFSLYPALRTYGEAHFTKCTHNSLEQSQIFVPNFQGKRGHGGTGY